VSVASVIPIEPTGMAIQAPPIVVIRMTLMTVMACIVKITGFLVACSALHSGVSPGLDIEPERTVGILPCILQMAFLAVQAGSIRRMGKRCRAELHLMAVNAARRSGDNLEGLQISMAVPAFEAQMGSHQRETGLPVIHPGHFPDRPAMTPAAVKTQGSLMIIIVAADTGTVHLAECSLSVALPAEDLRVECKHIRSSVKIAGGPFRRGAMALRTGNVQIGIVRSFVAIAAPNSSAHVPRPAMTLVACQIRVSTGQDITGLAMIECPHIKIDQSGFLSLMFLVTVPARFVFPSSVIASGRIQGFLYWPMARQAFSSVSLTRRGMAMAATMVRCQSFMHGRELTRHVVLSQQDDSGQNQT